MRIPLNKQRADGLFVWYWLQSPLARDYSATNAKSTSPTMKKLSQPIVMGIPFPRKALVAEQRRIVAYLDGLQAKASRLKALQAQSAAELEALLPSALDRVFQGEL